MIISYIIAIWFSTLTFAYGSNILAFFPMPSASHVVLGHELALELVKRGHTLTMITPYPKFPKIKNFHEIFLSDLSEKMFKEKSNFFEMNDMAPYMQLLYCYHLGYMVLEETYKDPKIISLLKSNVTFDVVIMDQFYNEGLLGIAHHFKAPVILSSSLESPMWTHHMLANPAYYSYIQNAYLQVANPMNFVQRAKNTALCLIEEVYRRVIAFPYHDKILHQHLPRAPPLNRLMYNVSLIFVNTHLSIGEASPKVPNMIEVAGMHIKPRKQLSKDLQSFMDNSTNGVAYFSMGSNLKPSILPQEKLAAILRAFSKLKINVLWKWDDDNLPGQPKNVKIGKWFSQVDILAHPNTRAFISHGGLLSTIESVYFGVPIIGIPVYADQKMNIGRAAQYGYAVSIFYDDLNEESLTSALDEVLNNPKYKENAKSRSKLMQDRPMKPLDSAVYWVEYIIRYGGAPHLRTYAMQLSWWQIQLIDVMAFFLAIILGIVALQYYIYKTIFYKRSTTPVHKKKQ